MKKFVRRKNNRRFFGINADAMHEIICTLCDMEDGIDMTEKEEAAMDIAIQAVSSLRNAMVSDGRIDWGTGR